MIFRGSHEVRNFTAVYDRTLKSLRPRWNGKDMHPIWPQHAGGFPHCGTEIGYMFKYITRDDQIEACVWESQLGNILALNTICASKSQRGVGTIKGGAITPGALQNMAKRGLKIQFQNVEVFHSRECAAQIVREQFIAQIGTTPQARAELLVGAECKDDGQPSAGAACAQTGLRQIS